VANYATVFPYSTAWLVDTQKDIFEFYKLITKFCLYGLGTFESFMNESYLNIVRLSYVLKEPDIVQMYANLHGLVVKQ